MNTNVIPQSSFRVAVNYPWSKERTKITPGSHAKTIQAQERRGLRSPQRGPVSLTLLNEKDTAYSLQEL